MVGAKLALASATSSDVLTRTGPAAKLLIHATTILHPNKRSRHLQANVKVHAVDTDTRIIFDTQVDVLSNAESKVTRLGEVPSPQLVLLDLETTLENLFRLGATNGDMNRNLFISADTEGTDGVTSLAYRSDRSAKSFTGFEFFRQRDFILTVDRGLTAELFKHLGGTRKSITRLADANVEHELLDAQLAHRVRGLVFGFRLFRGIPLA